MLRTQLEAHTQTERRKDNLRVVLSQTKQILTVSEMDKQGKERETFRKIEQREGNFPEDRTKKGHAHTYTLNKFE